MDTPNLENLSVASLVSPVVSLGWMGAVGVGVQTADKNITIIHTTPVHQLTSYDMKSCAFLRRRKNPSLGHINFKRLLLLFPCYVDYCDVLSAVWTLVLAAPIHYRASIGELVMQCYISPNLMKRQTHLHLGLPENSDTKLLLFGRAINASVKLDPLDVVGKKYKVRNYLDDKHPPRDFYVLIKPEIDEIMTKPITFDILFNNSEHQATMLRYGVKKSEQIEKVYSKIVPTWKDLFEKKKI